MPLAYSKAELKDTQNWTTASTVTSIWAYDHVGNRTSSTERGGSCVSYTYNDANMMTDVGGSSQTHDSAGNLTHTAAIYGGSTAYTLVYDHHNRLIEVKDNAFSHLNCSPTYTRTLSLLRARHKFEDSLTPSS